jgi:hypothetical protein
VHKKIDFFLNFFRKVIARHKMSIDDFKDVYAFSSAYLPQDIILNSWEPKITKPKRKKILDQEDYKERSEKYCACLGKKLTLDKSGLSNEEIVKDALSGRIYLSKNIDKDSEFCSEHYYNQMCIIHRRVRDILGKRDEYKVHNERFL